MSSLAQHPLDVLTDDRLADIERLTAMGLRLVPIRPGAKAPVWRNWPFGERPRKDGSTSRYASSSSTSDLARLAPYIEDGCNVAIPTGQPVWVPDGPHSSRGMYLNVLDVDAEAGGLEAYDSLTRVLGQPPATTRIATKTPGCFHLWLYSPLPWQSGLPASIAPGLEYKRALQLALTPPSLGYEWIDAPWATGMAEWPELDGLLSLEAAALRVVTENTTATGVPAAARRGGAQWMPVDDLLREIASAPRGQRTQTLLRCGGKLAYQTALGAGLASPSAVRQALENACRTNGLADDYPPAKIARLLSRYEEWADPSTNPLLSPGGTRRGASSVIGNLSLSASEKAVLADLGTMARYGPHEYAKRYGAVRLGISHEAVRKALLGLVDKGLLEQGPPRWNEGKRASHTYKLTAKGNLGLSLRLARHLANDRAGVNGTGRQPHAGCPG